MKIHLPQYGIDHQQAGDRRPLRLFSNGVAIVLCFVVCAAAQAQSQQSDLPASSLSSPSMVHDGMLVRGNEAFRVIDSTSVLTAADAGPSQPGQIAQVDFASGSHRRATTDRSTCVPCEPCANYGSLRTNFIDPCGSCDSYWYASIETLYMEPDSNNRFSLSPSFTIGQYDFEWAPRLTVGTVPDCVHGYEISYTGRFEWDRSGALSNAGGGINTSLRPGFPLTAADLTSFSNATSQVQAYGADYWSIEANRILTGWDVAKVLLGARYTKFEERLAYVSQTATETGALVSDLDNQLIGIHVGMDLLYPICRFGYVDFRSRLGGFINAVESSLQLVNNSVTVLNGSDDTADLAGVLELGGGIRFQLGRGLSVRAGGELWYFTGVATVSKQLRHGVVGTGTITSTPVNDDILIAGASVGAELKF